ncbi:MAG TPA: helix-turn-helix domain-containing protein [Nocardioides sp.]|nr:helix-turn-helix domain-containing protein [Nocardioides sp.]
MSIDFDLTHDPDQHDEHDEPARETIGAPVTSPEHLVEVRRRAGLAVGLGAGASLVAVAYLARAASGGAVGDWVLGAVLGLIGIANLAALLDARTPLLVADDLGVRLRLGRTWVGLPWGGLQELEHRPRRGWWRDGLLVVRTHYVQRVLEDLDPGARRVAGLNRRLHRAPLSVPLGLGTRVVGADPDLVSALRHLAGERTPVVEVRPEEAPTEDLVIDDPVTDGLTDGGALVAADLPETAYDEQPADARRRRLPDPRPAVAALIGRVAARFDRTDEGPWDDEVDEAGRSEADEGGEADLEPDPPQELVASATPEPARETVVAARAEVRHESRVPLDEVFEEDTQVWGELHAIPEVEGALLIDDYVSRPAPQPVLGPQFRAARERLGLSVDELAERTRIRPHVIEAVEVDDFTACGGDFYARGHLRTLARVLGVDVAPLLATYDERYADAPIDPRRVFEAELAGAGSIRATRGGPNWSVLVAAVMALVLCWSVARLVTGTADHIPDRAVLSGSGGPNHQTTVPAGKPVPMTLTAAGGGAHVVVRDGTGKLVFSGDLAFGQQHALRAATPIEVQSTDGGVQVQVDGQDRGRMGPAGRPATQSYVGRR